MWRLDITGKIQIKEEERRGRLCGTLIETEGFLQTYLISRPQIWNQCTSTKATFCQEVRVRHCPTTFISSKITCTHIRIMNLQPPRGTIIIGVTLQKKKGL